MSERSRQKLRNLEQALRSAELRGDAVRAGKIRERIVLCNRRPVSRLAMILGATDSSVRPSYGLPLWP